MIWCQVNITVGMPNLYKFKLYTIHYKLYTIHCTLYTIHYAIQYWYKKEPWEPPIPDKFIFGRTKWDFTGSLCWQRGEGGLTKYWHSLTKGVGGVPHNLSTVQNYFLWWQYLWWKLSPVKTILNPYLYVKYVHWTWSVYSWIVLAPALPIKGTSS